MIALDLISSLDFSGKDTFIQYYVSLSIQEQKLVDTMLTIKDDVQFGDLTKKLDIYSSKRRNHIDTLIQKVHTGVIKVKEAVSNISDKADLEHLETHF